MGEITLREVDYQCQGRNVADKSISSSSPKICSLKLLTRGDVVDTVRSGDVNRWGKHAVLVEIKKSTADSVYCFLSTSVDECLMLSYVI